MKKYSIHQASEKLGLSQSTLRYYDKLRLVSPSRGENRYRYYTEEDLREIKYVKVMSNAGFTLEEIRKIYETKAISEHPKKCSKSTIELIENRRMEILEKIRELHEIEKALGLRSRLLKSNHVRSLES